jgi:hypothetical protein
MPLGQAPVADDRQSPLEPRLPKRVMDIVPTRASRQDNPAGSDRRADEVEGAPPPPTVQYTVRSVPAHVDKALRRKAQKGRKSLNEVLRDALIREAEGADVPERVYADLDVLVGSWVDVPSFDDAIEAQEQVEGALWR